MKRNWMAFCLAAALMTAGTVYAKPAPSQLVPEKHGQCYVEDNLFVKDVNGAGGGQGVLHGDFAFRREQALKTDAIKEIGWMTLKPGSYIGSHTHKDMKTHISSFQAKAFLRMAMAMPGWSVPAI